MSVFRKTYCTLISFAMLCLFLNPTPVSAETGESAILHLKVNVWTEMKSMYHNDAQGQSVSVKLTVPVKEGELRDKDTLLKKMTQFAEPELKKKDRPTI